MCKEWLILNVDWARTRVLTRATAQTERAQTILIYVGEITQLKTNKQRGEKEYHNIKKFV